MAGVSGIDWPGDPGAPAKPGASPLLVIAMASTTTDRLPILVDNLSAIRAALRWSEDTPFHFAESDRRSRSVFFERIATAGLAIHVLIESKEAWYGRKVAGEPNRPAQLLDVAIASLVSRVPESMMSGQTILIDRPRAETAAMKGTVSAIRVALRARAIDRMPRIRPLPDHRADAQLIQVADMFAGALAAWGSEDPRLARLGDRLRIFPEDKQKPRR